MTNGWSVHWHEQKSQALHPDCHQENGGFMYYTWNIDDELSIVYGHSWAWRSVLYLRELELCLNVSAAAVCVQLCVHVCWIHILWGIYALVNLYLHGFVLRVFVYVRVCVCTCACVCLIALVTQAVSHSHCSKLWVGEGHCGADRGDRKERGDGG